MTEGRIFRVVVAAEDGYTEVDENGLVVSSDHYVVGLNVTVHDTNDLVAVLYRPQHVDEVVACLASRDTTRFHPIKFAHGSALRVVIFLLMIHAVDDVPEASLRVVFGD